MGRAPCCSKVGLHKGPWSAREDALLTRYIKVHGEGNWRYLPIRAGLLRCGKSCRLRWMNYLRPDIKRGNIGSDEEDLIVRLHSLLGNRWSLIAGRLPGRTDNEIKNYWNTHLSKKLRKDGIDPNFHKSILTPTPLLSPQHDSNRGNCNSGIGKNSANHASTIMKVYNPRATRVIPRILPPWKLLEAKVSAEFEPLGDGCSESPLPSTLNSISDGGSEGVAIGHVNHEFLPWECHDPLVSPMSGIIDLGEEEDPVVTSDLQQLLQPHANLEEEALLLDSFIQSLLE